MLCHWTEPDIYIWFSNSLSSSSTPLKDAKEYFFLSCYSWVSGSDFPQMKMHPVSKVMGDLSLSLQTTNLQSWSNSSQSCFPRSQKGAQMRGWVHAEWVAGRRPSTWLGWYVESFPNHSAFTNNYNVRQILAVFFTVHNYSGPWHCQHFPQTMAGSCFLLQKEVCFLLDWEQPHHLRGSRGVGVSVCSYLSESDMAREV